MTIQLDDYLLVVTPMKKRSLNLQDAILLMLKPIEEINQCSKPTKQ